ncbi:hypothetical protein A3218_26075 [Pseudomonas chlororaphis]|uniref:hypothetical protein n=1 Tax=Pseudomonas chlororaphis TaxID=587753 RepID=UPI000789EA3E|nr:hypothetical protein [Pseudomonas chlororaphis]AMS17595.1 hypothetical protein A3218_26075 [Pseudomonas chlororaphis]
MYRFIINLNLNHAVIKATLIVISWGAFSVAHAGGCIMQLNAIDGSPSYTQNFKLASVFSAATWWEVGNLPANSLMSDGTYQTTARTNNCLQLGSPLKGKRLKTVYVAPANATPTGNGFILPSSIPGVGLRLQFPGAVSGPIANSLLISTSQDVVSTAGGIATSPAFSIRISIIRTGPIPPSAVIRKVSFPSAGAFRYYAEDNTASPVDGNPVVVDVSASSNTISIASPNCSVFKIGSQTTSPYVFTLNSVNLADFDGVAGTGAISTNQLSTNWQFSCEGTNLNQPQVSFNASFPGVADGVGLPASGSPIGIQLLMKGTPVTFGQKYGNMPWTPLGVSNSGQFSQDDGGSWVTPTVGVGGPNTPIPLSFRYYKNGAPLVPGALSVNFTITINII